MVEFYHKQTTERQHMITVGSQFLTAKSNELVTAIEEPIDRGNGLHSVLVRRADGSTRYTTVKS